MDRELSVAVAAAQEAGRTLLSYFGRALTISTKSSPVDLVTEADRAAEKVVLAHLRGAFPDDGVLAEESGTVHEGARRWVLDPLDGTTNFAHGFPHFAVSVALYRGAEAQVGVIHDPLRQETFTAICGAGAWLDSGDGPPMRLSVTATSELQSSLLATGFGYARATVATNNLAEFARLVPRIRGIRRAGSAALDLAYVAAGRLDGYWEYLLAPWDWAAGALLVREAGGVVATLQDDPWHLEATSIVVANSSLLPRLRDALCGRT